MRAKGAFTVAAILVLISCINLLISTDKEKVWDSNSKLLKEQVLSMDETFETIDLSSLTPFEWDTVYSFQPYTSKEKIYEVIGYKWDNIDETVDEGMDQIVFTKDKKVVCYLYGYPSNNGYGVLFDSTEYKDGVVILNSKDNLDFNVSRYGKNIYLKHL